MATRSRTSPSSASSIVLSAIMLLGMAASTSRADLLNFQLDPNQPIILGVNGGLSYDAGNGNFHLDATALTYTSPSVMGGFAFIDQGQITVDMEVDNNGGFVANGTGVTVTGSIDLDGDGTTDVAGDAMAPLLTGSIHAFGAQAAGPPTLTFNGLFSIDGGVLTDVIALSDGGTLFGGFRKGTVGGFILSAENVTSGILGDFTSNFSSDSSKVEIGSIVPEPSGLAMTLLAGATMLVATRITASTRSSRP